MSTLALLLLLSGCGGEGSAGSGGGPPPPVAGPPPAPPPPPSPPPAPPPPPVFSPITGKIFASPQLAPEMVAAGKGWEFDQQPSYSGISNVRPATDFTARYEPATDTYFVRVPILGSGTLFQTGPLQMSDHGTFYQASVGADAAGVTSQTPLSVLKPWAPGTPFINVSWITWYTDQPIGGGQHRTSYGVLGLAQPTPLIEVPSAGTVRYASSMLAHLAGDVGSWIAGTAKLDFNFGARTAAGSLTLTHMCMMGCIYPKLELSLSNIRWDPGSREFRGDVIGAGDQKNGTLSGVFAGPKASELMITFETPYLDPDRKVWTSVSGVVLGRAE